MQLIRLGPYEIDKPLGKGGMGSVYAGTDTATGQRVAIKALSPQLAAAEGFRERFEAEIESLKTLRHDGIVRLYGYGEQDGVLFYSMELVEGISLEDELKAGRRFNWREVSNIAIQLSLALKHAHDHGIIHRDIKPANILLQGDEHVKLADFGIARLFGTTSLTTAGGVLGTADYMSPEQADGRPVTAKCDQYSLGGVMYALLAGRPPFRAKNLPQMLQMQRFANPEPVRRYAPDTPEQLEGVIMQLLAKEPAQRFPNTQVLARHLQAMVNALSRPAADDFALTSEQSPLAKAPAEVDESLATDATKAEIGTPIPRNDRTPTLIPMRTVGPRASQEAATLAADAMPSPGVPAATHGGVTESGSASTPAVIERPTRFTTLEEEELRRREHSKRSWWLVAGQLVAFIAVLVAMGSLIRYLLRPVSADKLYTMIESRVDSDDDASLSKAESEIDRFLAHYAADVRAAELQGYKERIELDRLDRNLQRLARGAGTTAASLLPAERLYLQALTAYGDSPERAIAILKSLVDLYGVDAPIDPTASKSAAVSTAKRDITARNSARRTTDVVQLARRRIKTLEADSAKQRDAQLKALAERSATAERLELTNAEEARAMYRAIVELYQNDSWAAPIVDKARARLDTMKKK